MARTALPSREICAGGALGRMWKLCACWLLFLCAREVASALSPPDAETLLQIKQQLYATASNYGTLEFWNSSSSASLCSWPRVTCNLNSSILSLSLQFLGLQGPVPGLLGSLPLLQELYLNDNNLTGEIPSSLFRAGSTLVTLNLGYNSLGGAIPSSVSYLQALVSLDLRRNSLNGTLQPLQGLNNATLRELYLDANNFEGDLSPLKSFSELRNLSVMQNQLTGQLDALGGLRNLAALHLSNNQLTGTLSSLASMTGLQSLDLGHNQFSEGIDYPWIGQLASLQYLRLNSNNFSGALPLTLGQSNSLLVVDLSSNQFSGSIPLPFCSSVMAYLDLSDNSLTGAIPDALFGSECNRILQVNLGGNQLTERLKVDPSVANLVIRTLDLSRNNLSGGIPGTLAGRSMPRLETLDLSQNSLQNDLLDTTFVGMDSLRSLNLSRNRISGSVPEYLAGLTETASLRSLDLSYNSFSGFLPSFPLNDSYQYSFIGNWGLCSPQPATQLPASCPPPPPPPALGYPLVPPQQQPRKSSTSNKVAIGGIAGAAAAVVVIFLVVVLVWQRDSLLRYSKLDKPDEDLVAAIREGVNVVPMSVSMLRQATDNFSESNKIGEGGFGTVYKGTLPDGKMVAIKKSIQQGTDESKRQFLNEVRILSQVNYRGLVQLVGCCLTPNLAALVFEFVSQGNLAEHLRGYRRGVTGLSWGTRLKIAVQAADALAYLHDQANPPIYHRDVKSSNILLDDNLDAKVSDFGISKLATVDATHVSTGNIQGTMGYLDPEYFVTFNVTAKSDVYSFGAVLQELLTAQAPLELASKSKSVDGEVAWMEADELGHILDAGLRESFESGGPSRASMLSVARLASTCLKPVSSDRPTMRQVLEELQLHHRSLQLQPDGTGPTYFDYPSSTETRDDYALLPSGNSSVSEISAGMMQEVFSGTELGAGR